MNKPSKPTKSAPGDERVEPRAYKSNLTKEQIRLLVEAIEMEGPEIHP